MEYKKYLFENPNNRLLEIVFKFTKKKFNPLFFQQDFSDRDFLEFFQKNHKPNPEKNNILEYRADKRYKELLKYFTLDEIDIKGEYLDIGCGDGLITTALGKKLGFTIENIHATDIIKPESADFDFEINNGKTIPFNKKFSLITLFQSLHHMKFLDEMLAEINRVTDKNSYLIIREHDLGREQQHEENKKLFTLEHAFYDIVYDGKNYDEFFNTYFAKYRTEHEWDILLSKIGFIKLKKHYIPKFNPTNYYYAIFKKI